MEYWLSNDKKHVTIKKIMEFEKRQNQGKKHNFRDIVAKGIKYKEEIKTIDKKEVLYLTLSSPPVSLGKSWSLTISLKKIILKHFELEITSKKIFLKFSFYYVRIRNHQTIIKQS